MRSNEKKDLAYEIIDYFKKNTVSDKRSESNALDFIIGRLNDFIDHLDLDIEDDDDEDEY